jgi:hypothetical protein
MKRRPFKDQKRVEGRYGPVFDAVRELPCWLWTIKYYGPGHQCCSYGSQGGHTAHHLGHLDSDGMIPVCGAAHDLLAGYGGRTTVTRFRDWLEEHDYDVQRVGELFYEQEAAKLA